jgi:hypothetical protein
MGGDGISDIQDEHHPLAVLLRVLLIDLAIQIEVCGISNLLWQNCKDFLRFDTGIDSSDSENFCWQSGSDMGDLPRVTRARILPARISH